MVALATAATPSATRDAETPAEETPAESLDFAVVYAQGYQQTLTRAMRQLGAAAQLDTGLADEVAQEAWSRVWRHWHGELECQPALVVYAWALRAATTAAIDLQRRWATIARHGQVRMTPDVWDMALTSVADPTPLGQPEAQAVWRELVSELRAVAAAIPETRATRGRSAMLLEALLADESQVATAARLGLTPGMMKMGAWRMRAHLRAYLTGDDAADDGEEAEAV